MRHLGNPGRATGPGPVTAAALGLLTMLFGATAGTVLAQQAEEDALTGNVATIETVAYGTIPPGARLLTQPETQGEMDNAAWHQANDDLAARGYTLVGEAELVFTVATQLIDRLPSGSHALEEGMQFSTQGGTLLNPSQPINRTDRVFRVSVTVYDRASGVFVWRGTVERGSAETDPAAAMRIMLPAMLDHFGETASGVTVPLAP